MAICSRLQKPLKENKMQNYKLPAAIGAATLALILTLSTSAWSATRPQPPKPPKPPIHPGGGVGVTPTSYTGTWTGTVTEGFVMPDGNTTSSGILTITIAADGSIQGTGPFGGIITGQIDSAGNISYQVVTTVNGQTTTGNISGALLLVPGGLAGQLQGTFTNPNAPGATNTVSTFVQLAPVS